MQRSFKYLVLLATCMCSGLACLPAHVVMVAEENAVWGGQKGHLKILTPTATYYFFKEGGGLSGMVDRDGVDWIGYSTAEKSKGQWRGIPNTNRVGWRPNQSGSQTMVVQNGPDCVRLDVRKNQWQCQWDFFADHATMTMLQGDSSYYFCYEGAPNGQFDPQSGYLMRPDLPGLYPLGQPTEESDIRMADDETWEWIGFGQKGVSRVLFLIHHADDDIPDKYRPLGEMTVFGFGRTGSAIENLTEIPQSFSIGFCEDSSPTAVAAHVRNMARFYNKQNEK
jgi:hypothetical protein